MDNALIVPTLFAENPQVAFYAVQQAIFGCNSRMMSLGFGTLLTRDPRAAIVVAGGVAIAAIWLSAYAGARQGLYGGTVALPQNTALNSSDTGDDALPIPLPQDKIIPNDYKGVFDVALGRFETLGAFAFSFTDRPTAPFILWPNWMVTDPKTKAPLNFTTAFAFESFKIAINLWNARVPTGRIKFNLEGLDNVLADPEADLHGITLKELRYILDENPLLRLKTRYYEYIGVAQELTGVALDLKLNRLRTLFGRLIG